jgi:hypothetical protein
MCGMLLFHGTTAPALGGILQHGLQPPQPDASGHDWAWELSGRAQGNAVVPNSELTSFVSVVRTRSWLRETRYLHATRAAAAPADDQTALARWTLSHWCLHYWLARWCADHQIALTPSALDAHLTLQTIAFDPALPPDLTPLRWQAFLDDYFRVVDFSYWDIASVAERERRRQTILRRHGIVLPEHIEEDEHGKHCRLCMRAWHPSSTVSKASRTINPCTPTCARCQ